MADPRNSQSEREAERFDAIIIGGGQAGLAAGHHLARLGLRFVILDAFDRVGDSWRRRWDGLRVFTPAQYDGLPGLPFPAPADTYPTKDEIADYLEAYAERFRLPVRTGVRVSGLRRLGPGRGHEAEAYVVEAGPRRFEAPEVVVATGAYHAPRIPTFAAELDPAIHQLHAIDYRGPANLAPGPVLVVGASNSGAEVAFGAAREHRTLLVGRDVGAMPFPIDSLRSKVFVRFFWPFVNHVVTLRTPIGRRAMPKIRDHGAPLERVRPEDIADAGVERIVGRVAGVRGGRPLLDDGRALEVATVIWCTGFRPNYSWIELPVTGDDGWPRHVRGEATDAPGLSFVGLPFLHSGGSALIGGVGRDAGYLARRIAARAAARTDRVTVAAVAAAG